MTVLSATTCGGSWYQSLRTTRSARSCAASFQAAGPPPRRRSTGCVALITRALDEGLPLLHYVPGYDAYSDITPITMNFELADRQYPGSKFIMTLRELEPWLDSRTRHVQRNIEAQRRAEYAGNWL